MCAILRLARSLSRRSAVRAALLWARAARHPRTAAKRIGACHIVLRRSGWHPDLKGQPEVEDALGTWRRSQPAPVQARPITYRRLRRATRRLPAVVRHGLRLLYAAAARPSDLLGSESRRPVRVADAFFDAVGALHLLFRRTKSDVEGRGRRVALMLPATTERWVRQRLRTASRAAPLLPTSYEALRAGMPDGYTLRSIRRGAVRAALMAGAAVDDVRALTGHADPRTVFRYAGVIAPQTRDAGVRASAAAMGGAAPERPRIRPGRR